MSSLTKRTRSDLKEAKDSNHATTAITTMISMKRDTQFKNPCCKHNKQHGWKDCPDNPANKSCTKRGEVSSMETSKKKTSFVRFKPNGRDRAR
jgi:hypothetical protein